MAAKKSPFFDTATTLGKIVAFLGISALCGVLAAGMLVPAAAIAKTGMTTGSNIVNSLPASFEKLPIPQPSQMLDRNGKVIATFYEQNRDPVKLEDISPYMRKAIVSVEDERFYEHNGVDPKGMLRAAVSNLTSSSRQGASTLTQQYVNNLLVNNQYLTGAKDTTVSGQKDYADKIREVRYSVAIENEMSKDEILEGYLNLVLFSGREYGVQAAAQRFFSVDAKDLNLQQSAMLAGMVQLPNVYNPIDNPERAKDRRDKVLGNMYRTGAITKKEYDKAVASKLETNPSQSRSGCMAAGDNAYFCDYATRLITRDEAFGKTKEDRTNLLYRGGLTIKTTLDSSLNKKAAKDTRKAIIPDMKGNEDIGASLVSVEPGSGNIVTMAQNSTYAPDNEKMENSVLNYSVERSLGGAGGFQGGSTMKPYTTLAWLHEGHHMYDKINAKRQTFMPGDKWQASCLPGGTTTVGEKWTPKNASYGFYKNMTVDYGLYWSVNAATVQEARQVDLCTITDYTTKLGVLNQNGGENGAPAPISPKNPSFVIGSVSITPLSQAAAFAAFANKGEYCEPRALTSVVDGEGNKYNVPQPDCKQVIDEQNVADLNGTLQKIATKRVSKGQVSGPIAGKTGTNNWSTSTWFVGYSTGISTAAWVGRVDAQAAEKKNTLQNKVVNGRRYGSIVDSSTFASPLWVDFMEEAVHEFDQGSFGSARSAPKPKPQPKEDSDSSDSSDSNDSSHSSDSSDSSDSNKSDSEDSKDKKEKSENKSKGENKSKDKGEDKKEKKSKPEPTKSGSPNDSDED